MAIPVRSPKEAIKSLSKLQARGIDALWVVPDKNVLAPAVIKQLIRFSYRNGVPLIGLSERHAKMGMLMSLSFASSYDIGRQAGELAQRIINGESPWEVPYTKARQTKLFINLIAARRLGIKIPDAILKQADKVIR